MDIFIIAFSRSVFRLFLITLTCTISLLASTFPSWANSHGGFLEQPSTAKLRPKLTLQEIQSFLPTRGAFTFPAPYRTSGIRLTNASDCNKNDCLWPVGYSYWRNINNHAGSDTMYIFLGLDRNRGGGGPTLFSYHKTSEEVRNLGPLFDTANPLSWGTGEGWYFSATQPTQLYLNDGPRMLRFNVLSKQFQTVFDLTTLLGAGYNIWQMHSSDNDRVHSATLRNATTHEMLGCIVYNENTGKLRSFPKTGDFDECHIDKSGLWLISLEDVDAQYGLEMRIFNLSTGVERLVWDQNGAVGHADMGYGHVVGTDNWNASPNAILSWDFSKNPLVGRSVFYNNDWSVPAANHISYTNARPDVPIDQQFACGSNATSADSPWGNEIICFRLDGSYNVLVAAPVMTDMNSTVGGDSYSKEPKGNLDVTGQYFVWTSNTGGSRVDAFIVKIPGQQLTGIAGNTPPILVPVPPTNTTPPSAGISLVTPIAPTAISGPQDVIWSNPINVTANGNSLKKIGGCDGCEDAGAISQQQISSANGYLEFTVSETDLVRFIGLNNNNSATSAAEIMIAFKLVSGYAEVRENGQYRADTPIVTGDKLRMSVHTNGVKYAKNGVVFYTSNTIPSYPLRVDTALTSMNATLNNVIIASPQISALSLTDVEQQAAAILPVPEAASLNTTSTSPMSGGSFELFMLITLFFGNIAKLLQHKI